MEFWSFGCWMGREGVFGIARLVDLPGVWRRLEGLISSLYIFIPRPVATLPTFLGRCTKPSLGYQIISIFFQLKMYVLV